MLLVTYRAAVSAAFLAQVFLVPEVPGMGYSFVSMGVAVLVRAAEDNSDMVSTHHASLPAEREHASRQRVCSASAQALPIQPSHLTCAFVGPGALSALCCLKTGACYQARKPYSKAPSQTPPLPTALTSTLTEEDPGRPSSLAAGVTGWLKSKTLQWSMLGSPTNLASFFSHAPVGLPSYASPL
jgi:hypothetical protein